METILFTLAVFAVLLVTLFIGTPISLGLGFLGAAGILIFLTPGLLMTVVTNAYNQSLSVTTLMIPMFILMAEFLSNSNIASDLFDVISRRLKKLPANLAISSIISSALFAALCGSAPATAATMGRISIPSMKKHGYRDSVAAGTQAAGGNLGIIIPPSINFIIYGLITETSIVKLFVAGVIPGIMLALMMIIYVLVRKKLDPKMIVPPQTSKEATENTSERISVMGDISVVVPVVLLIAMIFLLLYSGIATASETSAIGAIGAFIIVLSKRRLNKGILKKTLQNSATTSCMIMFLVFGGMTFSLFLTVMGLPQALSGVIVSASPNPWITLIIVNIVFLVLGCFMDPTSMMLIVLPFTFPFITQLGFDPIWFGVIITINCAIGMITPPVGMNLFVLKSTTGIPMNTIIRGVIPYVFIFVLSIVLLCLFPSIATYLPGNM